MRTDHCFGRLVLRLWHSRSIKSKLTALFLLSGLLPVLFFSCYIYSYSHKLLAQKELETMESTTRSVSASLSNVLQQMGNGIQEVLSFPAVQEALLSDAQPPELTWFYHTKQVENLLKNMTSSNQLPYAMTIVGANGNVYNNGIHTSRYERIEGELAQKVLSYHWRILLSKRIADDGTEVITMGKSVKQNNQVAGVVLFDLPVTAIDTFFSAEDGSHLNVFCLYEGEQLFYSVNNAVPDDFFLEHRARILNSNEDFVTVDGESYLCSVTSFGTDYTMVLLAPTTYIFAGSHQYLVYSALLGLATAVLGIVCAQLIAYLFTRPIRRLHQKVRRFGEDMTPITPPPPGDKGGDEIAQLGRECAQMSGRILGMVDQLKQNGKEKKRLELAALRSQFNPHMLYNTLNTISYLSRLQGAFNIAEVSEAFSRLMRSLSRNSEEFVPLCQEMDYLRDYVTIKKYNLLTELTLTISLEEELEQRPIIKLLLQPFVENAIAHGFSNLTRPAVLEVCAFSKGGYIHIRIADNGHGMDEDTRQRLLSAARSSQPVDHIGIPNTVRRLALTYESRVFFDIQSEVERYTIIELAYPDDQEEGALC